MQQRTTHLHKATSRPYAVVGEGATTSPGACDASRVLLSPQALTFLERNLLSMLEPSSVAAARDLLASVVKQAEQNLMARLAAGQGHASLGADPYTALVALATYTGLVVEGGTVQMSIQELFQ